MMQKIIISKESYVKWVSSENGKYYLHFDKGITNSNQIYEYLYPFECEARNLTNTEIKNDYYAAGYYSYTNVQDETSDENPIMWDILNLEDGRVAVIRYGRLE